MDKLALLAYVEAAGDVPVSSTMVAQEFQCRLQEATRCLWRGYVRGDLRRVALGGKYWYALRLHGRDLLAYRRSQGWNV